jgi:hypothetical protein
VVVTIIETIVPTIVSLMETNRARGNCGDENMYSYAESWGERGIRKNPRVEISACEANELPMININGIMVIIAKAARKITLKTSNTLDAFVSFRTNAKPLLS